MQLNRQTDYALRALLFLAMQEKLSTIDDISEKFFIAREHLTKIISRLAKLDYIIAIRGKGGGLKLNPNTLSISVAEIVRHFEPTLKPINCESLGCPLSGICRLNLVLDEASHSFISTLEKYTLKDILPKTAHEKTDVSKRLSISTIKVNDD